MDENEELDVEEALYSKFGNVDIEKTLIDTVQEIKNGNTKYLTHNQIFENARKITGKSSK